MGPEQCSVNVAKELPKVLAPGAAIYVLPLGFVKHPGSPRVRATVNACEADGYTFRASGVCCGLVWLDRRREGIDWTFAPPEGEAAELPPDGLPVLALGATEAERKCDGCHGHERGWHVTGWLCAECRGLRRRVLAVVDAMHDLRSAAADAFEADWQELAERPDLDPVTVAHCKVLRDREVRS